MYKNMITIEELKETVNNLNTDCYFKEHREYWKNKMLDDLDIAMNTHDCITRLVKVDSVVMNLNNIFDVDLNDKRVVTKDYLNYIKGVDESKC